MKTYVIVMFDATSDPGDEILILKMEAETQEEVEEYVRYDFMKSDEERSLTRFSVKALDEIEDIREALKQWELEFSN